MNRRQALLLALGAGLAGNAALLRAQAPAGPVRRIGVLVPGKPAREDVILKPFYDGMRELGWIEGRNAIYDRVYAEEDFSRLPALAAELAARKPDAIYAPPTAAALAAKKATRTIPIVFGSAREVVANGLVESLARPGGNVTGVTTIGNELGLKRLQLLREILPDVRRVGMLFDNSELSARLEKQSAEETRGKLGLAIVFANASLAEQIEPAVKSLVKNRVEALYATNSTMFFHQRKQMIALCRDFRLPVFGSLKEYAEDGALASYGSNLDEQLRRSAYLMDKVLKGVQPADIPVEQPTKYELVINVGAAKALGLKIPPALLQRADRVIE